GEGVGDGVGRGRLGRAAADWERLGRPEAALWGPPQLSEITHLDSSLFHPRELDFVSASKGAIRRRRLVRRGMVLGALALTALVYATVQLKVAHDIDQRVSRQLGEARSALDQARTLNLHVQALQSRAFGAFDAQRRDQGETLWTDALVQSAEVERFYGLATRSLAAALAIDPGQKGARALLADLFYERALLAQRDHQIKRRDELLDNMAIYDY